MRGALPVAGGFEVQEADGDEGYDPERDDDGADGENDSAHAPVFGVDGSALADAEDLSEKSDDENDAAENDCKQR